MHSLQSLQAALQSDTLDDWIARTVGELSPECARYLARVVRHDRRLYLQYPNSIGSCLVARVLDVDGFEGLRDLWLAELSSGVAPWIRPLQSSRLPRGLRASLAHQPLLSLAGLGRVAFVDDATVTLEPSLFHPSVENHREERLVWQWKQDQPRLEPFREPSPPSHYPRFEDGGWGPSSMCRAEGEASIRLPCPRESSANARLGRQPKTVIVYGSHDAYAGGFVWFVDIDTLDVRRKLKTESPVWSVDESEDGSVVLAGTSAGLVVWRGEDAESLALSGDAAVSPSGQYAAIRTPWAVQIWNIDDAPKGVAHPELPPQFSPAGRRLIRHHALYDGVSGRWVADFNLRRGGYLEGGPARPWLHLGDRYLIDLFSAMRLRTVDDGAPVDPGHPRRFPHWFTLAYDNAGTRLAALRSGTSVVEVHAIPRCEVEASVTFDLERADSVALSPSGQRVAIARRGDFEVRTLAGTLVFRHGRTEAVDSTRSSPRKKHALHFVDEMTIASRTDDVWTVHELPRGTSTIVERPVLPNAPFTTLPSSWTAEARGLTVFRHEPSGTEIALPSRAPWVVHPSDPTIVASPDCHVQLVEPNH